MTAQTIVPSQTAISAEKIIKLTSIDRLPATLFSIGVFNGTTKAAIKISPDGGTTSEQISQGGTALQLDADTNFIVINSPMTITLIKEATTAAVGIFIRASRGEVPFT